jgi:hypothetical protein
MSEKDEILRLDLKSDDVRGEVKAITTNEQLKALFRKTKSS